MMKCPVDIQQMQEQSVTSNPYVDRVVDEELDALLPDLPAVLIDGPKGVGKTSTALQRAETTLRLDVPAQLQIVSADPDAALTGKRPVLVDEWHRHPPVWDAVKRAVDRDGTGGQFLLTGSSPVDGPPTHSGAGRIASIRMRPFTLAERSVGVPSVSLADLLQGGRPPIEGTTDVGLRDYVEEIAASGLPGLRNLPPRARRTQLDGYLERIATRDLPDMGRKVARPASLLAWMRAYAAATSTTATWETIRDAATPGSADKPARTTTTSYVEALESLRVLESVPAWSPSRNHLRRLGRSPKHQLADPGLAVRLLGMSVDSLLEGDQGPVATLRDGTLLGHLFEALVTLSVRVFAQAAGAHVLHLRRRGGNREIDLIVERDDGRVLAIEAKLSATVDTEDVMHLRWLHDQIGDDLIDSLVLTTGPGAFRRVDGIGVVPLALLGP